MRFGCMQCIYYQDCPHEEKCEYYSPATEEAEDDMLESELEASRREFIEQWDEYVDGWD